MDLKFCCTLCTTLVFLVVVSSAGSGSQRLFLGHSNSHVLRAMYKGEAQGSGIVITAKKHMVRIELLSGKLLASSQYLPDSHTQLTEIMGSSFVRLNNFDYLVSDTLTDKFKPAGINSLEGLMLEQKAARELRKAITSLASCQEKELFLEASVALAKEGITGVTHPHVLPFFKFAAHIEDTARALKANHSSLQLDNNTATQRADGASAAGRSNSTSSDCLDDCPPCIEENCLGLCGYGCVCWSFICGDCCYHLGCYDHDMCCRQNFFDVQCLFPFQFECEEHYYC